MASTPDFHAMPNEAKHIYLIDDDESMRRSLAALLEFSGYQVHAFDCAEKFLQIQMHVAPAVIITDMRMPDLSGVELQAELRKRGRQVPIIFISGESTTPQVIEAMKGGAIEFLLKPFEREELLSAVVKGLENDANFIKRFIEGAALGERLKSLTPRELEVFNLLGIGYNNSQIQEKLNISLPTTKQYKAAVMEKLNLSNLSDLLALKNISR